MPLIQLEILDPAGQKVSESDLHSYLAMLMAHRVMPTYDLEHSTLNIKQYYRDSDECDIVKVDPPKWIGSYQRQLEDSEALERDRVMRIENELASGLSCKEKIALALTSGLLCGGITTAIVILTTAKAVVL